METDVAADVQLQQPNFDCENREPSTDRGARKNRLAALASSINNWEDDTSHPVTR